MHKSENNTRDLKWKKDTYLPNVQVQGSFPPDLSFLVP